MPSETEVVKMAEEAELKFSLCVLLDSNPHHARIIVVLRHVFSPELCEFSEGELCESCELCEFCELCELNKF